MLEAGKRFKIAVAQTNAKDHLDHNLEITRQLAADASSEHVRLFCLPEAFAFLGRRERDKFPFTEVLDGTSPGPILACLSELAIRYEMWISAGGIAERIETECDLPPDALTSAYNTHIIVDPAGQIAAKYRKIHLFDVDIPDGPRLLESENTTAGDTAVVAATDVGRLGLSICYDLRFPEYFRKLAIDQNAEVLLVPAAFTQMTGEAHWHTLLRARAIESQAYVVAAAQVGTHNEKRSSYGHSLIIDPWGTVLADKADGVGIVCAEIDLDKVTETRRNMPCRQHIVMR